MMRGHISRCLVGQSKALEFFVNAMSPSENFKQKDDKISFIILKTLLCLLCGILAMRRA